MRMAELADATGLPVATIKYYLREGLLHPGEASSATWAAYDDSHVRRLRLVRALTDVAHLRLDAVRSVVAAVEDESLSWHEAVGAAHTRLTGSGREPSPEALARVDDLARRHAWTLGEQSPNRRPLAEAIDALTGVGRPPSDELLDVYADAAEEIAAHEVASIRPTENHALAVEQMVVGTLLLEPVLLGLRRMAQESASYRLPG